MQRGRPSSYQGPGVERFLDGDGGGDCSSRDDDVRNYDDGSAGLAVMGKVLQVMVMAMEEVITKVQKLEVVEIE